MRDSELSEFNFEKYGQKLGNMSALEENADGPIEVIQVLFALHPSFGAQELCGPLEVLMNAFHKLKDPGKMLHLLLILYELQCPILAY